jgi:hypothetical protein
LEQIQILQTPFIYRFLDFTFSTQKSSSITIY